MKGRSDPSRLGGPLGSRFVQCILAALLLGVLALMIALLWREEGPLWELVMTRKVPNSGESYEGDLTEADGSVRGTDTYAIHGYQRHLRWGPKKGEQRGWSEMRYSDTGRLHTRALWRDGEELRATHWNHDGTVSYQSDRDPESCRSIGIAMDAAPPLNMRCSPLIRAVDNIVVGEHVYLPPWRWGVTDLAELRHGIEVVRWQPSGQPVSEKVWEHGRVLFVTQWNRDGSLRAQNRFHYDGDELREVEVREEPPWWPRPGEEEGGDTGAGSGTGSGSSSRPR